MARWRAETAAGRGATGAASLAARVFRAAALDDAAGPAFGLLSAAASILARVAPAVLAALNGPAPVLAALDRPPLRGAPAIIALR